MSPRWSPRPRLCGLLLLGTLLILPSCASLTSTAGRDASAPDVTTTRAETSYCRVARPLSYDRLADTEQTVAEIKSHNAVYDGLCPLETAPSKEITTK